ncbi:MAG: outer membrane lipoprotein carrier protein LolA [Zoogloeaceae bacterium]|jgi:outer membrane lipoprotein-sorting protein|nr:outer membrane lipoprotein carrier protein LolA [Zoogloeaceae bacterium]
MKKNPLLLIPGRSAALLLLVALPALCCANENLLEEVKSRLTSSPVIHGEFQQTRRLAQIKKPLVSHGRFLVARNHGVLWENTRPLAQITRLTREEILQTDGKKTLMKLDARKEPVVKIINGILFSVLSGDVAALAQTFDYHGKVEGKHWQLEFTPRDKNLARMIRALRLAGERDIASVEMENAAGDVTRIEFQAQTYAQELSADEQKRFE